MPPELNSTVLSRIFESDVVRTPRPFTTVPRDVPVRGAEGPGALRGAVVVVHDGVVRDRDPAGTCREDPLTDRVLGGEAAHACARGTWAEECDGVDEPCGVDDRPGHAVKVKPDCYEGTARDLDGPGFGLHR